jgi:hypothetical protein
MGEPAIRRMNLADSAEILRREGDHWITDLVRGRDATIRLASVDLRMWSMQVRKLRSLPLRTRPA